MRKPCLRRSLSAFFLLLETNARTQSITIDGSSTALPIYKAVADGFHNVIQGSIKVISFTLRDLRKICEPAAQGKISKWNHVRRHGLTMRLSSTAPAPTRVFSITLPKQLSANQGRVVMILPRAKTTTFWLGRSPVNPPRSATLATPIIWKIRSS